MPETRRFSHVARWGLWGFWAFTLVTIAGYATFGVNPSLLARFPQLAGFYAQAFRFFAVGHVWLAFGVLALFLALYAGVRWLLPFAAVYLISLTSELAGTRYGIPFGHYEYTALMEPMWFGRVPVVIPLSWFYMALPAYAIALAVIPGAGARRLLARLAVASAGLVLWDLSLDPAMSYATPYWVWETTGPYYGMPWVNLLGWFATGLLLMGAFAGLGADGWLREVPLPWLVSYYLANLALPLGMSAAAGLWGAVAATLVAVGGAWALIRRPLRARGMAARPLLGWRSASTGG